MYFLGKRTDETIVLININKPCGDSPEDTVKVYALGSGSTYNKVKDYTPMGVSTRDDV